jgi:hypothetical protein
MKSLIVAARPWFSWAAPLFVMSGVVIIILLMVGYYIKVVANKNPRD